MKIGHDLQSNISLGIGGNPDYGANAFLITEIHNFFNMGHTSYVHRFQREMAHVESILREGTGADRQLTVWERTQDTKAVVDQIVAETYEGLDLEQMRFPLASSQN